MELTTGCKPSFGFSKSRSLFCVQGKDSVPRLRIYVFGLFSSPSIFSLFVYVRDLSNVGVMCRVTVKDL